MRTAQLAIKKHGSAVAENIIGKLYSPVNNQRSPKGKISSFLPKYQVKTAANMNRGSIQLHPLSPMVKLGGADSFNHKARQFVSPTALSTSKQSPTATKKGEFEQFMSSDADLESVIKPSRYN